MCQKMVTIDARNARRMYIYLRQRFFEQDGHEEDVDDGQRQGENGCPKPPVVLLAIDAPDGESCSRHRSDDKSNSECDAHESLRQQSYRDNC